jgi:hypothetical protein
MSDGEPSLKCVIAWSDKRSLCTLVSDKLEAEIGASDIRRLGDDAFAIYGTAAPEAIRDCVAGILDADAGESVVVFEFEKWSGSGPGVDAEWLMRRGH